MDSFSEYLIERLRPLGALEAKRMFGGTGLYQSGRFFGIIFRHRLYFKTDAGSRARYLAVGMEPFRPSTKQTLKNYYEVPPEVIEDSDQLVEWALESVGAS